MKMAQIDASPHGVMSTTFTRVRQIFWVPNQSVLEEDTLLVGEMSMEWCHKSRPSLLQHKAVP
eukprot:scaffold13860_cov106-Skeletonema_dohrnii-CCMP3373.AAC.2